MVDAFDAPVNGGKVLEQLLQDSGVEYSREDARFTFVFASRGCKWKTVCVTSAGMVCVYAVHPAEVSDRASAMDLCSELNSTLVQGSFFLQDGHLILRTGADLFSGCDARETLARALEYNAAAMSWFWTRISAVADGCPPVI